MQSIGDEASDGRRHLALDGMWNVRELGGYSTSGGSLTRWNSLLRGDAPCSLPPKSRQALVDYGLRTVIDLRRVEELEMAPNDFADARKVRYVHVDLVGDAPIAGRVDYSATGEGRQKVFVNKTDIDRLSYVDVLEMRKPQVAQVLTTLARQENLPALFHCGAGKDRTGVIAALLLSLAGVPEPSIAADYALSSKFLVGLYRSKQASQEDLSSGYDWRDFQRDYCSPDAIIYVFDHLRSQYGGVEPYIATIGITADQVRSLSASIAE